MIADSSTERTFDDLAVRQDRFASRNLHHVVEVQRRDHSMLPVFARLLSFRTGFAQRRRLSLAASFGHGLGKLANRTVNQRAGDRW